MKLTLFLIIVMLISGCGDINVDVTDLNKDPILVDRVIVKKNKCQNVAPGIWVENIHNGDVFDVYYNSNCNDTQGEYCDNVATIEGSTGSVNPGQGSGTICWVGNLQFSGIKLDNDDIEVYILDFN